MRIGLFGGTFDPVHIGHLIFAEQALTALSLDEIWWIPAGEPPHKQNQQITPSTHRANMVQLAIAGNPAFRLSRIELERTGPSYTIYTLEELVGKHPENNFFLLIGADMVKDLPNWYKMKKILQFVQVVGIGRPGFNVAELPTEIAEHVVWITEAVETNLSSSLIRERWKSGKSIRYLVPSPVFLYLKEHGLYGT